MTEQQTVETAIMPFKVQQLVEIIMERKQLGCEDAFDYLYHSNSYKLLFDEEAKLWYMSGLSIFEMIEEEKMSRPNNPNMLLFFSFCLEKYKLFSHLPAEETLFVFQKYHVFDYLRNAFEMLHTQGELYIMEEIDEFIKIRKK
jgi:hypothetical protein